MIIEKEYIQSTTFNLREDISKSIAMCFLDSERILLQRLDRRNASLAIVTLEELKADLQKMFSTFIENLEGIANKYIAAQEYIEKLEKLSSDNYITVQEYIEKLENLSSEFVNFISNALAMPKGE